MQNRESRRARAGWASLGLAVAGLVALVVPAREIQLGRAQLRGLTGSYLYEQVQYTPDPVSNVRCTDIYLPKTLRIEWDSGTLGLGNPTYEAQRSADSGATWTTIYTGANTYVVDAFNFSFGTTYRYRVRITADASDYTLGLPAPPASPPAGSVHTVYVADGTPWTTISVTPQQAVATDNQAVDSRLDPRYSTNHLVDFQFANLTYRGGLFAGYNQDPAKVGRSFLKFNAAVLPSGTSLWASTVNAYWLRNYANGSVTVGCQTVGDSWTQSAVKWSTAPSVTPGSATQTVTVSMSSPGANSAWVHWGMKTDYAAQIAGDGIFSVALASTSETTAGWAYFAKKEYDSSLAPCVLYAYGN